MFVLIAVALLATGCAAPFPNLTAEHWIHQGSYGPVTTNYEATHIVKNEDGSLTVATYSGSIKVLGGYGVSDTVSGLKLSAKQAEGNPTPTTPVKK